MALTGPDPMRAFPLLGAPLFAAALACQACAAAPPAPAATPSVTLAGHRFGVEIATTPAQQERGLMFRTAMPADHGMLFVFSDDEPRTFWMKNTLIPLDMLFFDGAHRLVAVQQDAQPCEADPCKLYPSGAPARYVLELNAGTAARLGLRKGDVITFSDLASGTQ
ncbi:MAG TPA: DUF192 domain-containing protein [Rhodanobacteraceae bacterium]|nr:DUF192 domain-containing protein [Rhodanobacteraceae bacterium]